MRAHNCKFKGQFNTSDLSKARNLLMHRETIISSKFHLELIIIINALFKLKKSDHLELIIINALFKLKKSDQRFEALE